MRAREKNHIHGRALDEINVLSTASRPFARVSIHREPNTAVIAAWADLEQVAPCTIYQTRAWLLPWLDTLGLGMDVSPLFIVASDVAGDPAALLCLGIRRLGPFRLATFLGGKHGNLNMGLFRPGAAWTPVDLKDLFSIAATHLGADAPHAYVFRNQPVVWAGLENPMAALKAQPSPSAAFGMTLSASADELFNRKLSKANRKKLRKKEHRLAEMGAVIYRSPVEARDRAMILDAFGAQKVARLQEDGIVSEFGDPLMRRFIETANIGAPHGIGIELHALCVAERVVAVYGGAAWNGHWSGMFNSYDADPDIARSSPGELLLMKVIATQCAAGRGGLDLGIGEARYKAVMCDEEIALVDTFLAMTTTGAALAVLVAAAARGKRLIKQNPVLMRWMRRLRGLAARGQSPKA